MSSSHARSSPRSPPACSCRASRHAAAGASPGGSKRTARSSARATCPSSSATSARMHRSELTIDLSAIRRNAATLRRALDGGELWAVVKADGYGHGARDVAGAALIGGATALCVVTVPEALALRAAYPDTRILVMGPWLSR